MNGSASWVKVAIAVVPTLWLLFAVFNQISTTASAVQAHVTQSEIHTALLRAICRHGARNPSEMNFCDAIGYPSAP